MQIQRYTADRTKRLLAYLIDILPIIAIITAFFYFFLGFDETWSEYLKRGDNIEPRIKFLQERNWIREISFLIWVVYCIFMESSPRQGTFGKWAMGIKVVDEQGQRMTVGKSVARNASKVFSYVVIFLGFIWILFDKKRQGWHDKVNKTFVVDKEFENQ